MLTKIPKIEYTQNNKKIIKLRGGGYHSVHMWLSYHYGKATKCENETCSEKSNTYNWCLLKGKKYEHNVENFVQLCVSCHRKYDGILPSIEGSKKAWRNNRGKKLSLEVRERISLSHIGKTTKSVIQIDRNGTIVRVWKSITEAVRLFGISRAYLKRSLKENDKFSKGYIWKYQE